MKKLLSVFLIVAILVSSISVVASAYSWDEPDILTVDEAVAQYEEYYDVEVDTNRYYFLMPNGSNGDLGDDDSVDADGNPVGHDGEYAPTWYIPMYDGSLATSTAGIYWWDSGVADPHAWIGYLPSGVDENDTDVYYADVPTAVKSIIWNNAVDSGMDSTLPIYYCAAQTANIFCGYYDPGESPNYPDGLSSFDNMIYVIDPDLIYVNEFSQKQTCGGEWYYYYGDGCYGFTQGGDHTDCLRADHYDENGTHIDKTEPTVEPTEEPTQPSEPTQPPTEPEHTYTVAGAIAPGHTSGGCFGTAWYPYITANDLVYDYATGMWSITYTDVAATGETDDFDDTWYEYKIVQDHGWEVSFTEEGKTSGESINAKFDVDVDGSTVTIWFDGTKCWAEVVAPEIPTVEPTEEPTSEPTVEPTELPTEYVDGNVLMFDSNSTDWGEFERVYCHIWTYDGYQYVIYPAFDERELCTDENGNGIWIYDLDAQGVVLEDDKMYVVVFMNENGKYTYSLVFDTSVIGDIAYCKVVEQTDAYSNTFEIEYTYWKQQHERDFGPLVNISEYGDVTGVCIPRSTTAVELLRKFIVSCLEFARTNSGKSDQTLIDNIAVMLNMDKAAVAQAIEESGVYVQWSESASIAPEPTVEPTVEPTEEPTTETKPATPDQPTPKNEIYIDMNTMNVAVNSNVYCHIFEYGGEPFFSWMSRNEMCQDRDGDGIWTYNLDDKGIVLDQNKCYGVIFMSGDGMMSHPLVFGAELMGATAYTDGTYYEAPEDSSKRYCAFFWRGQDPEIFGPEKCITTLGNVVGTCVVKTTTVETMFKQFLVNGLETARLYSGKSDQAILDDIAKALGLLAPDVTQLIKASSVDVEWESKRSTLHTFGIINGFDATCETDGLTECVYCITCNEIVLPQEVIPAFGHNPVIVPAIDATCQNEGRTRGSACENCGEVYIASIVIPKLEHDMVCDNNYLAPGCETDGHTESYSCSMCNMVMVESSVLEAIGHNYQFVDGKPATPLEDGLTDGVVCSNCKHVIVEQVVIPALGVETGDVSGDGKITITDTTLVQRSIAKIDVLSDAQLKAADTNGDGTVNIMDATLIQRFIAKIIESF